MVRAQAPDATLAHFVHIPWAQSDYWRILPEPMRREITTGCWRTTSSACTRRAGG